MAGRKWKHAYNTSNATVEKQRPKCPYTFEIWGLSYGIDKWAGWKVGQHVSSQQVINNRESGIARCTHLEEQRSNQDACRHHLRAWIGENTCWLHKIHYNDY